MLSALISGGTAAKIGPLALAVLVCLRTHANYQTGRCSIGQRLIAKQIGSSPNAVGRAIAILEENGLIKVISGGKATRAVYEIVESIPLFHDDKPAGEMTFPFQPLNLSRRLDEAREIARTGEVPPRSPIHLNLTINIIQNNGGTVVINEGSKTTTHVLDGLTGDVRTFFARMLKGEGEEEV